jgi:hypothetical protein
MKVHDSSYFAAGCIQILPIRPKPDPVHRPS